MKLKKSLLWLLCSCVLFVWLSATATNFKGVMYDGNQWTITITDWKDKIIVADKNVWAIMTWYWKNASEDSYGLYYQWWWMTWYEYSLTAAEAVKKGFIKEAEKYSPYAEWWTKSQQTQLCGNNYHIPTNDERVKIQKMYENNGNKVEDFAEAFMVPFAGVRSFLDADNRYVKQEWNLWTSSSSSNNYAPLLKVDNEWVDEGVGSTYVYGYPIRCVKNEKSVNKFSWVSHDVDKWLIMISDWKSSITIADKNVWASVLWYWVEADPSSYGYYYQWWWTTWYSFYLTKEAALSNGFVQQLFDDKYGAWDKQTENIKVWKGIDICGKWYHIPSYTEWRNLINMFKSNWNKLIDFYEAFQIPAAWERSYHDVIVTQDRFNVNLWSSTPFGNNSNSIYYLYANEDNIQIFGHKRANAFPVRCFRDDSGVGPNQGNIVTIDDEMFQAHQFAYERGITSIKNAADARLYSNLTRIAMAKMLSNYAINVLGKQPANVKVPKFSDVSEELNEDYGWAVDLAYQLWIMWIWINNFRPNDTVTRAEFATALSRLLYSTKDWTDGKYYTPHLMKLYEEWIISVVDPKILEKRWYVMLMLMRSAK